MDRRMGTPRSSPKRKRNWRKRNAVTRKSKKGPRTGQKLVSKWLASIKRLPTGDETINTSSRLASYAKTKSSASRVCTSRIWSKTTAWQKPSVTWVGLSLSDNLSTKPHGMGEPWSKLTHGIPPPNAALIVDIFSTPYHLMYAGGRAQNVALSMSAISMRQRTFWPRDSRLLPVE